MSEMLTSRRELGLAPRYIGTSYSDWQPFAREVAPLGTVCNVDGPVRKTRDFRS